MIWPALQATEVAANFRKPGGASRWHSDLVHERQPAGVTHLHNDIVPPVGGDTLWASGYAAYEKLSPEFRKIIDGKKAVYRSAHPYLDRENPTAGPQYIERTHPLVRVHPATGWKALWVNRAMTSRIVGLDKAESDLILGYLYDVYEKNVDIQVRFKWTPRTSALWDNRYVISMWELLPVCLHLQNHNSQCELGLWWTLSSPWHESHSIGRSPIFRRKCTDEKGSSGIVRRG